MNYSRLALGALIIFMCMAYRAEPGYLGFIIFLSLIWTMDKLEEIMTKAIALFVYNILEHCENETENEN